MDEGLMNLIAKADAGDVDAMVMVGDCYNRGFHTNKDDVKAQSYYKMAADKGHVAAAFMVGLGYLFGTGVKKDKTNAIKYIQDAADKGFANAQHMMGMMYQSGEVGAFFKKQNAVKYFKMAAQQGHAEAQFELGKIYLLDWSHGNTRRFDDGLFWMVCAAMHTSIKSSETSTKAKKLIDDTMINRGYPTESIKRVIEKIRRNYPNYIVDPN